MDSDLDHDDAIGQRLRGVQAWRPVTAGSGTWQRVRERRRRDRARHSLAGTGAVLVAIATIAVFVNLSLSGVPRHVEVVGPASTDWRPIAPTGAVEVSPAGPYRPGQTVQVVLTPTRSFTPDDPLNTMLDLCYRWSRGENCDPTTRSTYGLTDAQGISTFRMHLPGWVYTPTGRRPCDEVRCRIEFENFDGSKVGSKPLDIRSGPEPNLPAHITAVGTDARLEVRIDGVRPDPSWARWAKTASPAARRSFPPGGLAVCSFTDRYECDGLVRPSPPPFDGRPHDIVVSTNRLLLTRRGWVDCVKVQCSLSLTKNIGVVGTSSDVMTIALLPYRLPGTTSPMHRPTLTIAPHGTAHVGDTLTVTLREPPPFVDPARRLQLGQCASNDLRRVDDCVTRFTGGGQTQAWTKLADGSLRQRWEVAACPDPRGCYLAILPPVKGYPAVARTARFAVKR